MFGFDLDVPFLKCLLGEDVEALSRWNGRGEVPIYAENHLIILVDCSTSTQAIPCYREIINNYVKSLRSDFVELGKEAALSILPIHGTMDKNSWIVKDVPICEKRVISIPRKPCSPLGKALEIGLNKASATAGNTYVAMFADGAPTADIQDLTQVKNLLTSCRDRGIEIQFFGYITQYSYASIHQFVKEVGFLDNEVRITDLHSDLQGTKASFCQSRMAIKKTFLG